MSIEDDQFQRVVTEGLLPRVEGSHVCISIVPRDKKHFVDAKFCVELGVMIMLDKPILAVIDPSIDVPKKLALVAEEVVRADITTEEGQAEISQRIAEFAKQHQPEEQE